MKARNNVNDTDSLSDDVRGYVDDVQSLTALFGFHDRTEAFRVQPELEFRWDTMTRKYESWMPKEPKRFAKNRHSGIEVMTQERFDWTLVKSMEVMIDIGFKANILTVPDLEVSLRTLTEADPPVIAGGQT